MKKKVIIEFNCGEKVEVTPKQKEVFVSFPTKDIMGVWISSGGHLVVERKLGNLILTTSIGPRGGTDVVNCYNPNDK
jgi:hypothetical protein